MECGSMEGDGCYDGSMTCTFRSQLVARYARYARDVCPFNGAAGSERDTAAPFSPCRFLVLTCASAELMLEIVHCPTESESCRPGRGLGFGIKKAEIDCRRTFPESCLVLRVLCWCLGLLVRIGQTPWSLGERYVIPQREPRCVDS